MDEKNINNMIPASQQINASSPGTLALERFKLAMTINEEEGEEAQKLKSSLLED